jgi:hypothetical protein
MMYLKIFITFIFFISLYMLRGCDDYGNHGPTLSGTVTFTGTNELKPSSGGYFAVLFFDKSTESLHNGIPKFKQSLSPEKKNDKYTAGFGLESVPAGSYFVAVSWIHDPYKPSEQKPILGVFGCDTIPNCSNYTSADGTKSINIIAYGDTAMKLFYNN